ncbi:hypothetical protein CB0940_10870 [Cercospora beticola]|uniref:Fork-head domain-containing protein n=1 Tax=Cercospora beticola TaxID=122368 RepID=A0A2G5HUM8_CERBT|nr:hypothetical protein CB0940_10870 [Cercospora beticola]PIA95993.1 hypothetical protein CB0940_10870 [Cercospora beticola]WPB07607.1 hypothetical protein RHO25_012268 [Cercospora beticola]
MSTEVPNSGAANQLTAKLKFVPTQEPLCLRDEVAAVIKPWSETRECPPFTTEELIVLALVMIEEEEPDRSQVLAWIYRTFQHYGDEVHENYANFQVDLAHHRRGSSLKWTIPDFFLAIRSFDLPCEHSDPVEELNTRLKVSLPAARVHLRQYLEPARQGTFDFPGLSAELREKICKMLLVYPDEGFKWRFPIVTGEQRLMYEFTGLAPENLTVERTGTIKRQTLILPVMSDMLCILRVSKQLYSEALPVFYEKNTFCFNSLRALELAMRSDDDKSKEAKQHIRHLHVAVFCSDPFSSSLARDLARLVTQLDDLAPKQLVLHLPHDQDQFLAECRKHPEYPWMSNLNILDKIPGMLDILALAKRAGNIEWHGDGIFKMWLLSRMRK